MKVLRDISARLCPDFRPQSLTSAREDIALTTHGVLDWDAHEASWWFPVVSYHRVTIEATPRKRRLSRAARRQIIEEAASRLFAERGYAATTLEDVAGAAGVTKPVLYQHFESKKDLHLTLLAQHRDALLTELAESLAEETPLSERIPRVADAWFSYVERNRYAWAMLFRDTTGDPEVQAFYREMQGTARSVLVALIEAESDLDIR